MSGAPIISGIDEVPEPGEGRDDERGRSSAPACTENEPVEGLRVDELRARPRELGAEEHRQQPADDEEEERRHDVLDADHLVVGVDPEVVAPAASRRGSSGRPGAVGAPDRVARSSSRSAPIPARKPSGSRVRNATVDDRPATPRAARSRSSQRKKQDEAERRSPKKSGVIQGARSQPGAEQPAPAARRRRRAASRQRGRAALAYRASLMPAFWLPSRDTARARRAGPAGAILEVVRHHVRAEAGLDVGVRVDDRLAG